ncbi:MAG: hypothetical protein ABIN91_06685 [Mucilaginibacter sp.]|uniref:hypothetical protein n=1 Tax=Mucilaginibacter sp. TaxID=1882438 RepID=UPI00326719FD
MANLFILTPVLWFNFHTYPNLIKLFKEIGGPIKKTDMSFSVQHKMANTFR